jgi:hypothetical protein
MSRAMHVARIPMDLGALRKFARDGFPDVAVYAVPLGDEVFEVAVRCMPCESHAAPTVPARAADPQEVADVLVRMCVALTTGGGAA